MTGGPAGSARRAGPEAPRHAAPGCRAGEPLCGGAAQDVRSAGFSLVELLACAASIAVVAAMAIGLTGDSRRRLAAEGAARHLALSLRAARTEAVRQGRSVAVQFLGSPPGQYRVVADGNGNGVRRTEIASGVDPVLAAPRALASDVPGALLGVGCACPGIEGGPPLSPESSPVQFGDAGLAVFTPEGTATSGTLYVTAAGAPTYAVRVLGTTGRTRVLRFEPGRGDWVDP